jgi:hypothetical protein
MRLPDERDQQLAAYEKECNDLRSKVARLQVLRPPQPHGSRLLFYRRTGLLMVISGSGLLVAARQKWQAFYFPGGAPSQLSRLSAQPMCTVEASAAPPVSCIVLLRGQLQGQMLLLLLLLPLLLQL